MDGRAEAEPEGKGAANWGSTIRELHDARDAAGLIDLLDGEYWVWVHAREALTDLGPSVADALLAALGRPEPRIRAMAAGMLGALNDLRAISPLLEQFRRIDPVKTRGAEFGVWEAVTYVLGQFRTEEIVESLIDVLRVSAPAGAQQDAAQAAAKALGDIGDRRAVPSLVEALDVPNPFVQRDVADALRKIGDERGIEAADRHDAREREEQDARSAERHAREAAMSPGELAAERLQHREEVRRRLDELFNRGTEEP